MKEGYPMKKQMLVKILLILLPVLAVGLATTMNSVTVFDPNTGATAYYSYFDLLPVKNQQIVPALAAVLALGSGILAAVYLGKKKAGCLKASGYIAFASAIVACIPILIRGEEVVVPNVGLPVFMLVQFLVARYAEKMPVENGGKNAPKLKARR
jgi:hypothetical protein